MTHSHEGPQGKISRTRNRRFLLARNWYMSRPSLILLPSDHDLERTRRTSAGPGSDARGIRRTWIAGPVGCVFDGCLPEGGVLSFRSCARTAGGNAIATDCRSGLGESAAGGRHPDL